MVLKKNKILDRNYVINFGVFPLYSALPSASRDLIGCDVVVIGTPPNISLRLGGLRAPRAEQTALTVSFSVRLVPFCKKTLNRIVLSISGGWSRIGVVRTRVEGWLSGRKEGRERERASADRNGRMDLRKGAVASGGGETAVPIGGVGTEVR